MAGNKGLKLKNLEEDSRFHTLSQLVTGRCNLDCKYCFVKKDGMEGGISYDMVKRSIDLFFLNAQERKTLIITGGEPLLEYKLILKAVRYFNKIARKNKCKANICLNTNGTLLNKERAGELRKHGVRLIVSIDGKGAEHDKNRVFKATGEPSLDKIKKNISGIDLKKLEIGASLVFTPENLDKLLENIKYLVGLDFFHIEFFPENYSVWSPEKLKQLENTLVKFRKYYVRLFKKSGQKYFKQSSFLSYIVNGIYSKRGAECGKMAADQEGTIYLCDKIFSLPPAQRKRYIIGNARQGLDWKKRKRMLSDIEKKFAALLDNKCGVCAYRKYCFCPIGTYIYFSHQAEKNPDFARAFCFISRSFIRNALKIKKDLVANKAFRELYRK